MNYLFNGDHGQNQGNKHLTSKNIENLPKKPIIAIWRQNMHERFLNSPEQDCRLLLREKDRIAQKTSRIWKQTYEDGYYPSELYYETGMEAESIKGLNEIPGFEKVTAVKFHSDLWLPDTPPIDLLLVMTTDPERKFRRDYKEFSISIYRRGGIDLSGDSGNVEARIEDNGEVKIDDDHIGPSVKDILRDSRNLIRAIDVILDSAESIDRFSLHAAYLRKEREVLEYKPGVSIASATSYPKFKPPKHRDESDKQHLDNIRGDLAIANVLDLIAHGYRVDLIDYRSSEAFIATINSRVDTFNEENGAEFPDNQFYWSDTKPHIGPFRLWNQKKGGYSEARREGLYTTTTQTFSGHRKVIMQMEIEKLGMAPQIKRMIEPIRRKQADIIIPDRGIRVKDLLDQRDDFRGYPEFQARSERKGNLEIYNALMEAKLWPSATYSGKGHDYFGGTRVMAYSDDLLSLFQQELHVPRLSPLRRKVNPDIYLNAVYYPVYLAMALGYKVGSVSIDFSYPASQAEMEARNGRFKRKREKQFNDVVEGSKRYIEYLGEMRDVMKYGIESYIDWLKKTHPDLVNLRWKEEGSRRKKKEKSQGFDI